MSFFNKVKWILGILMVFGVIAATNLIDKDSYLRMKESVENIYEDRLMAKSYIFDIIVEVNEKEVAVAKGDTAFFSTKNESVSLKIKDLVDRFSQTELTQKEEKVLRDFEDHLEELEGFERAYQKNGYADDKAVIKQLELINQDLRILSSIQLEEGERQLNISRKAIEDVELFTKIEIYVLIALAIMVQIIVMWNPKSRR
ncbi:MAG: chemotaxis protein [Flavobacteriales bacterium]|nr:chemotaxis protein [Flavobacteriales bacterium]|tara:strand:- start:63 stop:662 length:600 start_codon:yes stop_codon:yes gene_type:complete